MINKWNLYYKKTLNNIHKNIKIFELMLILYYKLIIKNKIDNDIYIKRIYIYFQKYIYDKFNNYTLEFNIFEKLILNSKNIGIFTIFNNIPDIVHPLEKEIYFEYGSYISFIDPIFFNIKNKKIIKLKNNIFKYTNYKYPLSYQDITPYNKNKRYLYINIKYFDILKYKNNHVIIIINKLKEIFIICNNIIKQKINNKWIIINNEINTNNIIYISILRKLTKTDIINVFNLPFIINKNTNIYAYHQKTKDINNINWYSINSNEKLFDPYNFVNKENNIIKYTCNTKKDLNCLNLNIDILSNNNLNLNTIDISEFLNIIYNKNKIIKKYKNKIFNGNLNYIHTNNNQDNTWFNNKGKRLLYEIIFKSSNWQKSFFTF